MNSIDQNAPEKGHLRTFGIGFFVILGLIGVVFWWKSSPGAAYVLWVFAAVFGLAGVIAPTSLGPVYRPWMVFAEKLAWLNTRLLLAITFYLVITPIGALKRVFGGDSMARRKRPGSYWVKPRASARGAKHFNNQF